MRAPSAPPQFRLRRPAFTLVELMVVIGLVMVLASLLISVLPIARESARRVECASRLRHLAQATVAYATDNLYVVPGTRDYDPNEHCIWISAEAYEAFSQYSGSHTMLACPNLEQQLPFRSYIGWVIGYNYLAGHPLASAANGWVSPMKLTDPSTLPVAADLNDWSPPDGWTVVPHPRRRGSGFVYDSGLPPSQFGAEGGNVAYLDGSVAWRDLSAMTTHGTYNGSSASYLGMW